MERTWNSLYGDHWKRGCLLTRMCFGVSGRELVIGDCVHQDVLDTIARPALLNCDRIPQHSLNVLLAADEVFDAVGNGLHGFSPKVHGYHGNARIDLANGFVDLSHRYRVSSSYRDHEDIDFAQALYLFVCEHPTYVTQVRDRYPIRLENENGIQLRTDVWWRVVRGNISDRHISDRFVDRNELLKWCLRCRVQPMKNRGFTGHSMHSIVISMIVRNGHHVRRDAG